MARLIPGLWKLGLAAAVTGIVVVAASVLLLHWYIRANTRPAAAPCVNNLRLIDGVKQEWALENRKTNHENPSWEDLRPYLIRSETNWMPKCPNGGKYILGRIGEPPRCSLGGDYHKLP